MNEKLISVYIDTGDAERTEEAKPTRIFKEVADEFGVEHNAIISVNLAASMALYTAVWFTNKYQDKINEAFARFLSGGNE